MKTLRKNYLVLVLSVILTLCLSLVFAFSTNAVKAETDVNADLFAMEKGAQAALTKDGLRFRVQMGQNVYDEIVTGDTTNSVKLSVFIGPKENVVSASDYDALVSANKAVEVVFDDEAKIYQQGDYYWANAVLTNLASDKLAEKQMNKEFSAIACVKSNGEIIETATVEDGLENNARTQYGVLQSAVLSVENEEQGAYDDAELLLGQNSPYKNWFGTEDYPVKVETANAYSVLKAKVAAGLTTSAQFNVYNKFELSERVNLPENTAFYHYVNFYEDDKETLIDEVVVKEGETAETTKTPARVGEELVEYHNSLIYEYYFSAWKPLDDSTILANLTNIKENKSVYAYYGRERIEGELLEEASKADPSIALFFGERFGFTQLKSSGSSSSHPFVASNREYHSDMEYDGFKGMTSYTVKNSTKDARMIFNIEAAPHFTYESGDYVMFYVYVEIDTTSTGSSGYVPTALVRCNNDSNSGVWCSPNTWTKVVFPAEEFLNKSNSDGKFYLSFGAFFCAPAAGTDNYTYYISNVKRISGDDVMKLNGCIDACKRTHSSAVIGDNETYNLGGGDVSLIGQVGINVWGSNYTYVGELGSHVYYADGCLMYNEIEIPINNYTSRQIDLTFEKTVSDKLYIVAKGFGLYSNDSVPELKIFDESGAHKASPTGTVVKDLGDGYKVWEFNLGTVAVKKVRLTANSIKCNQIVISNISTTNPAA